MDEVLSLNRPELELMLRADHRRHLARDVRLAAWVLTFLPDAVYAGVQRAFGDKGQTRKGFIRGVVKAAAAYDKPRVRRGRKVRR